MARPRALDPAAAHEAISRLLSGGSDPISFPRHALERSEERQFSRRDVRHVLMTGTIGSQPTWDDRFEQWKYRVQGRDLDGEELTLIVSIEPEWERIAIITGF